MLNYLILSFRSRWIVYLLIASILMILGTGYGGTQVMTQGIAMSARGDLEDHWRWQYDILVYPKESQEYQGLGDGWVAPQTSIASYGGISIEDLEKIQEIPGVKVAAPLSILGYFDYEVIRATFDRTESGNIYQIKYQQKVFDGLKEEQLINRTEYTEYIDPTLADQTSGYAIESRTREDGFTISKQIVPPVRTIRYPNQMLLVAVDPELEEQLYNLSDSVVEGENLFSSEIYINTGAGKPVIPVIAIKDQGLQVEESIEVSRVEVPESTNPMDLPDDEAISILESLPKTPLASLTINPYTPEMRYKNIDLLFNGETITEQPLHITFRQKRLSRFTPIDFQPLEINENGIPLLFASGNEKDKFMFEIIERITYKAYREQLEVEEDPSFAFDIIGYYDAKRIEPKYASSWQQGDPIDLYTPQHSMILADGAGNPVDPRPLVPLPMKDAYYTGAPDALTTMDAAKVFYGDDPPISSVRVVVSGIEERSEESQKKIEQVAQEIMDKTGHNVEIMLGSSAGKVQIQLGGAEEGEIGLVEEGWQQMGVSWEIEEQISVANRWLFIYLVVIIFVLSYTVITHSLLKRSAEFAMLRAIGWPRSKIIRVLFCEIGVLSLIPVIGILLIQAFWDLPLTWLDWLLLLFLNLAIISIGYYSGSRKALWDSPRAGLAGEGGEGGKRRLLPIRSVFGYVAHQLLRRPLRFGLMLLSLMLSTMMVLLFVATQQSLSDFLFLSFLGEIIDLQLKPYQTAFLILGILFTVTVVVMLLFLNLVERRKELYIMRSIGWSVKKVQKYLLIESGVVGVLGGILGTIAGYSLLTYFSSLWLPAWVSVLATVFPFLLLILFTWILYHFFAGSHSLRKTME